MDDRGALELSITAIVVLIIAITVLSLGVGFIKKNFDTGSKLVEGSFSEVKQKLKDRIKESGELLIFSYPDDITKGTPEDVQVAVLNTLANPDAPTDPKKDSVCFRVEVKCIKPFAPGAECIEGKSNPVVVGGWDSSTADFSALPGDQNWFKRLLGEFDLPNYESDAFEGVMLVKGIKSDSYSMEVNVYSEPTYKNCEDASWEANPAPYATKSFVLNVV